MINRLLLLAFLSMSSMIHAEQPAGFLWYNVAKEPVVKKSQGIPFSQLSYTDKDAVLKYYTLEALHKVRFTHKLEDERVFLALQDYWLREASLHGELNQQALLYYPEYDFSVTHPTSDLGSKFYDSLIEQKQKQTVKSLAKNHGLLFFYRANNPLDLQQIPILKDFCQTYHFHLMPVSVDGIKADDLPQTRLDKGQAEQLGVRYFPAIVLVNPKEEQFVPVAYGLTTQDRLTRHLNAVANHFNAEAT
ncbi:MAG: type-F conjugative transfer system pilin assembly protein TraF [Legionellaceae bacterium]|nr:type-F conjugative transfer system pilin assembly protein TraF [Legionellaceae bacterium]